MANLISVVTSVPAFSLTLPAQTTPFTPQNTAACELSVVCDQLNYHEYISSTTQLYGQKCKAGHQWIQDARLGEPTQGIGENRMCFPEGYIDLFTGTAATEDDDDDPIITTNPVTIAYPGTACISGWTTACTTTIGGSGNDNNHGNNNNNDNDAHPQAWCCPPGKWACAPLSPYNDGLAAADPVDLRRCISTLTEKTQVWMSAWDTTPGHWTTAEVGPVPAGSGATVYRNVFPLMLTVTVTGTGAATTTTTTTTITSTSTSTAGPTDHPSSSTAVPTTTGLAPGKIAGIAAGVLVAVFGTLGLVVYFLCCYNRRKKKQGDRGGGGGGGTDTGRELTTTPLGVILRYNLGAADGRVSGGGGGGKSGATRPKPEENEMISLRAALDGEEKLAAASWVDGNGNTDGDGDGDGGRSGSRSGSRNEKWGFSVTTVIGRGRRSPPLVHISVPTGSGGRKQPPPRPPRFPHTGVP